MTLSPEEASIAARFESALLGAFSGRRLAPDGRAGPGLVTPAEVKAVMLNAYAEMATHALAGAIHMEALYRSRTGWAEHSRAEWAYGACWLHHPLHGRGP